MTEAAALIETAKGSALQGLARVEHFLEIVAAQDDPADVLHCQLAPHVFDCAAQMQVAIGFACRCVMPLVGRPADVNDSDVTLNGLRAQVAAARLAITDVTFARSGVARVQHRAGDADLDQSCHDYVVTFAIPNLWFHVTMAYATLRAAGVPVGKADFDGLHTYAPEFHFV